MEIDKRVLKHVIPRIIEVLANEQSCAFVEWIDKHGWYKSKATGEWVNKFHVKYAYDLDDLLQKFLKEYNNE